MKLAGHRSHAARQTNDVEEGEMAGRQGDEGRHGRKGHRGRGRRPAWLHGGRAAALAGAAIAIAVAPVALASGGGWHRHRARMARHHHSNALRGGIHNPPFSAFSRTTGIFSNNHGWVTRTKNLGSGGAAMLLCHASPGGACLAAKNSSAGMAFSFSSAGSTGGTIQLKNAKGAPFTTNAHGVATGLNANFLQGKQAAEFQLASKPAQDSAKLGGQPPSHYVSTEQLMFADVAPGAKLENARGATAVSASGTVFTVTFGKMDLSKCSFTASPQGGALTSGQLGVGLNKTNKAAVEVSAPAGFTGGFDLQVVC